MFLTIGMYESRFGNTNGKNENRKRKKKCSGNEIIDIDLIIWNDI